MFHYMLGANALRRGQGVYLPTTVFLAQALACPNFDTITWINAFSCFGCPAATSAVLQSTPAEGPAPNDQEHDQHGFPTDYFSNKSLSLAQCSLLPVHDYAITRALGRWASAPIVQWLGCSLVHHSVLGSSPGMPCFDPIIQITHVVLWLGCSPAHQFVPGSSPGIPFLDSIIWIK